MDRKKISVFGFKQYLTQKQGIIPKNFIEPKMRRIHQNIEERIFRDIVQFSNNCLSPKNQ